jgi:hypothetical protein
MLAVCLMTVGSMLYGFNEATDGLLLKSIIAAYNDR